MKEEKKRYLVSYYNMKNDIKVEVKEGEDKAEALRQIKSVKEVRSIRELN